MKTTISFVVLLATAALSRPQPGLPFLLIWPTARSTALAGAMTGLADEADATYFNPAGLAFQTAAKANLNYGDWLPGLYGGMCYASAAGGAPMRVPLIPGHRAFIAGSIIYFMNGETEIADERGKYLGRFDVWHGVANLCVATTLTRVLGIGVGVKLARSAHTSLENDWPWEFNPELVLEPGGTTTATAADLGALYRPLPRLGFGLALTNLGPRVSYAIDGTENRRSSANLPRAARLGLHWTPVESRLWRLQVASELDKVLIGMFWDTTGTKTIGRMLGEEWQDVWKSLGVEAIVCEVVSLRLGYIEDLTGQRGGIVLKKEGQTYHYGIYDVLVRRGLGKLKSIGLCWGFGIGTSKLRFDFGSDGAIYDFPTSNWKVSLVANDIAGGIRELSQGYMPWEE